MAGCGLHGIFCRFYPTLVWNKPQRNRETYLEARKPVTAIGDRAGFNINDINESLIKVTDEKIGCEFRRFNFLQITANLNLLTHKPDRWISDDRARIV